MHKARSALGSLRNVAEWMAQIRGRRKTLVYHDNDYLSAELFTGKWASSSGREFASVVQSLTQEAVSAAQRANVQVYPLDPRGLATTAQEAVEVDRYRLTDLHLEGISLEAELQDSQARLRQMAEETGGIAMTGTNDFTGGLDRIVRRTAPTMSSVTTRRMRTSTAHCEEYRSRCAGIPKTACLIGSSMPQ